MICAVCNGSGLIEVDRVGAYSVDQLIASAGNVFPGTVQKRLPTEVVDDFKSAGACLAYEQPTACGFHVYRAAEGVIRAYCHHFGAVPTGSGRDWGKYIKALRDVLADVSKTIKPNKRTVELLDAIRDIDRNPLAHPELSLDNDAALMAFDLCKNAISLMIAEIYLEARCSASQNYGPMCDEPLDSSEDSGVT